MNKSFKTLLQGRLFWDDGEQLEYNNMVEIEFTGDRSSLTITPTVTGQVEMPQMATITIYGLTEDISTISWSSSSG